MKQKFAGMTLVELLVSLAVFVVVATVALSIVVTVVRSGSKTRSVQEVKQDGERAVRLMTDFIRRASSLSSCPASATSLSVIDSNSQTTVFSCQLDPATGENRIASTSASTIFLTSSRANCANLTFNCTTSGGSPSVNFSFGLTSTRIGIEGESRSFSGQALLLQQ